MIEAPISRVDKGNLKNSHVRMANVYACEVAVFS